MRARALLLPALLLAVALAPPPAAVAGQGFLSRSALRRVFGSSEFEARGGYTAYFRSRNDHGTVQGFKVWVKGLDAVEATVWMAKPGDAEAQEVASVALGENGSGFWEVVVDSSFGGGEGLPLGAASVLEFFGGVIEIRVAGDAFEDEPVLRSRISRFRWRDLDLGPRGRTSRLRRAPSFEDVVDDFAVGTTRLWRRRGGGTVRHGLAVFARNLTPDDFYDVLIEDAGGTLILVGEMESTSEGLGYYSEEAGDGETFTAGLDADTIRDLSRRRVELRRSGFTSYSLAGLFPRVR